MTSVHPHPPRHRRAVAPLGIALAGARGSAVIEAVAPRLERAGHRVAVVERPFSALRGRDVVLLFGAALVPAAKATGAAVAVHLDDADSSRGGSLADRALRVVTRRAARSADAIIVGTAATRDAISADLGRPAEVIPAGAAILNHVPADLIEHAGLIPGLFHVATAPRSLGRLAVVVDGFRRSHARMPLVLLADGRRADAVRRLAAGDDRIRVLPDPGPRLRDQLAAHALSSLHAGVADGSLVEAMGAGTAVVAVDLAPNREVVGTAGLFFLDPGGLAAQVEEVERYPSRFRDIGELMQERARARHRWDAVAERYAALAARLAGARRLARAPG